VTLEEIVESHLILHVIDASDPDRDEKRRVVLDFGRIAAVPPSLTDGERTAFNQSSLRI